MPAYARYSLAALARADPAAVVARLARRHRDANAPTVDAWRATVAHLRAAAADLPADWHVLLEYPLPRRVKRLDAVVLAADVVFVLEYKTGKRPPDAAGRRQAEDYALDLRDFHAASRGRVIVPVLVAPHAGIRNEGPEPADDPVQPVHIAGTGLAPLLLTAFGRHHRAGAEPIDPAAWDASPYRPVPTIIEAARHLYAGHAVAEITRTDAGAKNLSRTTAAVRRVVADARTHGRKAIAFVTGVPGAGKTLAGLDVVHGPAAHLGVFLSGNGPLVRVLSEALAQDRAKRTGEPVAAARRTVGTFLQNVHGFLDQHAGGPGPPPDRVVVFDEAQRAWDAAQAYRKFRREASEPVQMLRVMDRHPGWAVVVALVGGGQEINRGEAGLPEWGRALRTEFPHWRAVLSPGLVEREAAGHLPLFPDGPGRVTVVPDKDLHLAVSQRTYRAGRFAGWVDAVLAGDAATARKLRDELPDYPLVLTRDLEAARRWLREHARGTRRAGLVASSGGRRLRPYGLDVTAELDEPGWFLRPPEDVRSSSFLELAATEFAVQGLELDWAGVCWDLDVRRAGGDWSFHSFEGTAWKRVADPARRRYMLNKYRVLLTRAREGLVVWVPPGSADDPSRPPAAYDATADYLLACGMTELSG